MLKLLKQISDFHAANNTNSKELTVLGFISENETFRIKDIADFIGVSTLTMTPLLDSMEKKRLIKRVPSKEDRRAVVIKITKEGERAWAEFEGILTAI